MKVWCTYLAPLGVPPEKWIGSLWGTQLAPKCTGKLPLWPKRKSLNKLLQVRLCPQACGVDTWNNVEMGQITFVPQTWMV